jgi:hypothetical protein
MKATISDLTDISADELEDIGLYGFRTIDTLTVKNLHELFFLLKLDPTGEPTSVITLNYLTKQAIKLNKQIF